MMARGTACFMGLIFYGANAMAQAPAQAPAAPQAAPASILAGGYLPKDAIPDSSVIVPAPAAAGSPAQARDDAAAFAALTQQGGARWTLAIADADLRSPDAIGTFSCAAGFALGGTATPAISHVLRRASSDIAISTSAAKRKYQRPRPFMTNGKPICTPGSEAGLRQDGSYPSGHSGIGYGMGLMLAEIVPSRATELVARGRAFGDSRRICNVHWLSDIEEGRVMGAATLARLHADATFRADMAAARAEADAVIARGTGAGRDCAAEAATIAATK